MASFELKYSFQGRSSHTFTLLQLFEPSIKCVEGKRAKFAHICAHRFIFFAVRATIFLALCNYLKSCGTWHDTNYLCTLSAKRNFAIKQQGGKSRPRSIPFTCLPLAPRSRIMHPFSSSQHSTHISLAAAHKDRRAHQTPPLCITTATLLGLQDLWTHLSGHHDMAGQKYSNIESQSAAPSLTQKAAGELLSDKYIYSDEAHRLGDSVVGP